MQSSYFDVTAAHDRQGLIKRLENYGPQQRRAPVVEENCKNDTSFAAHLWYMLANKISCEELEKKKKSRDITLPTKFRLVKAMFFPVVMYGCERWTIEKDES